MLLEKQGSEGAVAGRRKPSSRRTAAVWILTGADGSGRPIQLTLAENELRAAHLGISVGRHPALCGRVIDDPTLSRRHFRVGLARGGLFVEDLNSLNGTLLDGIEVPRFQPIALAPGQSIVAGSVKLTVALLPTTVSRRRQAGVDADGQAR